MHECSVFRVLSTPVFKHAFHKRASFDSVFRCNAWSLTSNLLKGTHNMACHLIFWYANNCVVLIRYPKN